MKVCDLTQFYSPVGGGVKRYIAEKVRYIREHTASDEHLLIIPGAKDEIIEGERSRTYRIEAPLISRASQYRVIFRLEAIERILEEERPDIIECGDPYQVAWQAVQSGAALGIPVVGFYHSHFPEAYIRSGLQCLGQTATEFFHGLSRRYIGSLYRRFERTIVPSPRLGDLLEGWGLRNIFLTDLGVDGEIFQPKAKGGEDLRGELGISKEKILLLYVGRLAQEKNTRVLCEAFRDLCRNYPQRFHFLIIGDGVERSELAGVESLTHLHYCDSALRLAACYRAADLFVHPGLQETFGLVALEAQACGTRVVGIRGSYMDRIIHCDQAGWATANHPRALAVAIEEATRDCLSWSGGALSQLVINRYSWREIFCRLFNGYAEVIADFQRQRRRRDGGER